MPSSRIPYENGYSPLSGCYGVHVSAKEESRLRESASMEILYDEFVDYNHTAHTAVLPWNGVDVDPDYVEKLLNQAKVLINIQEDNVVKMVLRCVQGILKDPKRPPHCSVYIEVMSDKDTADYSPFSEKKKNKSASKD